MSSLPSEGRTSSRPSPSGRLTRHQRDHLTDALVHALASATEPSELRRLRGELILVNRPVAQAIARRYRDRGIPEEDLEQVAYEGLVKAVHRYDPRGSSPLLTFAVPTIRGELQRHFRDHGWAVRPPRRVQELQAEIGAARTAIATAPGCPPSEAALLETLGCSKQELREALAAFGCFRPLSLDEPQSAASTATRGDLIPGDDDVTAMEARLLVEPLVSRLPTRDRQIVHMRFVDGLTQKEIGAALGVTQMQVSRLLTAILDRLRAVLADDGADV